MEHVVFTLTIKIMEYAFIKYNRKGFQQLVCMSGHFQSSSCCLVALNERCYSARLVGP
jgi:hypothetical protein